MLDENNKNLKDTVVIACHCYLDDVEEFKKLCREQGKFHSEVLRLLIMHYCYFVKQGWAIDDYKQGWHKKEPKTILIDDLSTETETEASKQRIL